MHSSQGSACPDACVYIEDMWKHAAQLECNGCCYVLCLHQRPDYALLAVFCEMTRSADRSNTMARGARPGDKLDRSGSSSRRSKPPGLGLAEVLGAPGQFRWIQAGSAAPSLPRGRCHLRCILYSGPHGLRASACKLQGRPMRQRSCLLSMLDNP